ncbi:MAG: RNA pseudouridine synthase [Deltaproteobacteria bacterium]|nr:RNA pseudouridine synthase [Deltaproteobacteria bacterium]
MTEVKIVHRDDALLVLYKPSGLPTTSPAGGGEALTDVAKELDPGAEALHATSRLDAEVTGLVTFARTRAANHALLEARRGGRYLRRYVALALAAPEPLAGAWRYPIAMDPQDPRKRRAVPGPATGVKGVKAVKGAKDAETRYRAVGTATRGQLLSLWPQTGRTHQLRVHAAEAGIPLFGDVHYGGARRITKADGRVVTARRVMLHCAELTLPNLAHPAGNGEPLSIVAPIPADLARVYGALGGAAGDIEGLRGLWAPS